MRLTSLKCVGHLFGRSAGHTCLFRRLNSFLTCTWLWACFPRFPQLAAEMHHVRNQCACPRLCRTVHTGCSSGWKLTCDAALTHIISIWSKATPVFCGPCPAYTYTTGPGLGLGSIYRWCFIRKYLASAKYSFVIENSRHCLDDLKVVYRNENSDTYFFTC